MLNWKKWIWPGILSVIILTAVTVWFRVEAIQNELTSRATEALSEDFSWAEVAVEGRDLTLTGTAPSEVAAASAADIAKDIYGIRQVVDKTELPPVAKPFEFRFEKTGSAVRLSGHVPSDDVKQAIVGKVLQLDASLAVDDALTVARGAPETFDALTDFVIDATGSLSEGSAQISDNGLTISGRAKGLDEYDQVVKRLTMMPAGTVLKQQEIVPPVVSPYVFAADYAAQDVTLTGYAPDATVRDEILAVVNAVMPGANVDNQLRIASGAPEGFVVATKYLTGFFPFLAKGSVRLEDQSLSVDGIARSLEDYDEASKRADNPPTGFKLGDNAIEPSGISPYSWSVERDGTSIVLDGFAPGRKVRSEIVNAARLAHPSAGIVDNMKIAAGAPGKFLDAVNFGIDILTDLREGKVSLTDNTLSIDGTAADAAGFSAASERARSGLDGFDVAASLLPPKIDPFRWSVSNTSLGLVLRGSVENSVQMQELVGQVEQKFGTSPKNRLTLNSGAPANLVEAQRFLIDLVSKLEAGEGNLVNNAISVSGRAFSQAIADAVDNDLRTNTPNGYAGSSNIAVVTSNVVTQPEPAEGEEQPVADPQSTPAVEPELAPEVVEEVIRCQAGIASAINGRKIQFQTARALILSQSEPLLNAVADAAEKCPDLRILVSGHTDDRGGEDYNQDLSEARAAAVVRNLIAKGVDPDRLQSKGFGETTPIASNETVEGRAENRRIDFTVSGGG